MVVGVLQIAIRIAEAQSLKEKRWHLKSLTTRIRSRFNVSIAETDSKDLWQSATLAVAHVGSDRRFSNQQLDRVLEFVREVRQIEVIDSQLEFYD